MPNEDEGHVVSGKGWRGTRPAGLVNLRYTSKKKYGSWTVTIPAVIAKKLTEKAKKSVYKCELMEDGRIVFTPVRVVVGMWKEDQTEDPR